MTAFRSLLLPGLAAALCAGPAAAQELFLGSRTTLVTRNDPLDGSGTLVGACGGIVHSMAALGGDVYVGDVLGRIYRWNPAIGFLAFAFPTANDARALVAHNGDLLVGGTDGTILRYDPATGVLKATLDAGVPVHALTLAGGQLIVGTVSGLLLGGDPVVGGFQFFGVCGFDVASMTADPTHLIVADVGARIWRFELATKTLSGSFQLSHAGLGIAVWGGDLLVGSDDGLVRRLDRKSGVQKHAFQAAFPVDALAILGTPEPGVAYCFGLGCPCGNNDPENACVNSTGFGSGLVSAGTASVAADDLEIVAYDLPKNVFALYYMGLQQSSLPFGDGLLCAGGGGYPVFRFAVGLTGALGLSRLGPGIVDFAEQNFGIPGLISAGTQWNFQAWHRDPAGPCGTSFNTSGAYHVAFVP